MKQKVCDVAACQGCPMRNQFPDSVYVPPRQGNNLRLQIGECPGPNEAELGKPFGGTAGGWVRQIYQKAGLNEAENSAINVIQCFVPELVPEESTVPNFPTEPEARKLLTDTVAFGAVEHCRRAHVEPFLKSRPWERLDVFGDSALRWVLGKGGGITNWRGSILPVPALDNKPIAIATFHPSYIAKDQSMYPVAINDIRKTLEIEPEHYNIYPSIDDVRNFRAKSFAFDIETDGWTKNIKLIGLSAEDYKVVVVPYVEPYITEIKRIFIEAEEVIGQNIVQFDLPVLKHNGVEVRGPKQCMVWDIMLMHHLRFPTFPHDLEFIGKQFTNKGAWKKDKASFETYCARDVDVTFRSWKPLKALLEQASLTDTYQYVSWPMGRICKLMTETGLVKSSTRIKSLRVELANKIAETELLLPVHMRTYQKPVRRRQLAPEGYVNEKGNPTKYLYVPDTEEIVPWRSAASKLAFLYEELKDAKGKCLPVQRHLKTKQPTCDKNALDKLFVRYKLPELSALKDLNKWATLLSNFAKDEATLESEVIHPSFNVHGTEAGRLSSSGPNIQNQPQAVRYTYVPRTEGGRILSADFSGIENRLTAFLARDRKRQAWFKDPNFCLDPETKVLTSGLRWVPVRTLKAGDEVWSVSENGTGHQRKVIKGKVLSQIGLIGPRLKLHTTKGALICSPNHRWLASSKPKGALEWTPSSDLSVGSKIAYFVEPWETAEDSYLSGFLDGEGCVHNRTGLLGFSQNPGPVLDKVVEQLSSDGFSVGTTKGGKGTFLVCWLRGQKNISLRAIGRYRPVRLLPKTLACIEGRSIQSSTGKPAEILSIEVLKDGPLVSLETDKRTFIAEGFVSHNSEHKYLAGCITNTPYAEVEKSKERDSPYAMAKVIVHGSDRLMGAKKIASQYDLDIDRVKDFQATWKREIADTIAWQRRVADSAQRIGYVCNPFGRRLWLWEANSATRAVSFYPQSTAFDVIARAMIGLMFERIDWPKDWAKKVCPVVHPLPEGVLLLAQVHDELLTETENAELVKPTFEILTKVMTQPWPELNGLSLPIGTGVGPSWGDCE